MTYNEGIVKIDLSTGGHLTGLPDPLDLLVKEKAGGIRKREWIIR